MKRRDLLKAALGAAAASGFSRTRQSTAGASSVRLKPDATEESVGQTHVPVASGFSRTHSQPTRTPDADYIVVGSGAGGGTVAARLAEAGYRVLVLEAGGDPRTLSGSDPLHPNTNVLPEDYDVPAFHPLATENDALKWDFYVRHYADQAQQENDPHYVRAERGVWYPRAGTLGGCTAHNAMILVYPGNRDWDGLADLTGDPSWRADAMRTYFERLEDCRHRPVERFWSRLGVNRSRHGYSGWLSTEKAVPADAIRDDNLRKILAESVAATMKEFGLPSASRLESLGDPNDWRVVAGDEIGSRYTPLTTRNHQRVGTRERLLEVCDKHPDRLRIELNALATRVIFDERNPTRAIGVAYRKGERLYRAHPRPSDGDGELRDAYAAREVILAGGAFNTPQLLMLSGIGPPEVLSDPRIRIDVRVPLPGVGKNLQDRYEVAVVNRMKQPWDMLQGATFSKSDPQYARWADDRRGVYTTNGAVVCVIARSMAGQPAPDLFCYALLADFRGYVPGYSTRLPTNPDCLTWVVLKGRTNNTGGEVTLTSPDPRDRPAINFRYFNEGTDTSGDDLQAVVNGIRLVRRMTAGMVKNLGVREEFPGPDFRDDDNDKLEQFVRDHAWGHHASCTCAIGLRERGGVLTSDFKVHGTAGLRVVDASVFPRVPGLFIVSAIYMIGEKAADVIIADAKRTTS